MKTTVWHFFFILRIQCLVEDDTFSTFHFVEHSFRISTLPYSKPFFHLIYLLEVLQFDTVYEFYTDFSASPSLQLLMIFNSSAFCF